MSDDFRTMRTALGLTLERAAELSEYSTGTINGLELHNEGSQRLRNKLKSVYSSMASTPLKAAAALAKTSEGTTEDQQATFEAAAEMLVRDRASARKLSEVRALIVQVLDLIDREDDLPGTPRRNKKNLPREAASNKPV